MGIAVTYIEYTLQALKFVIHLSIVDVRSHYLPLNITRTSFRDIKYLGVYLLIA